MPQIQSGLVSYLKGSSLFTGNANTDWSGVSTGNSYIGLRDSDFIYQVAAVRSPLITGVFWEIDIVGVIYDENGSELPYGVHKDFTPNLGLAVPQNGDYQIPLYLARNSFILDKYGLSTPYTASQDEGFVNLTAGQTTVPITFHFTLGSASYFPDIEIINTSADTNKNDIRYQVRNRTTNGMTVFLFNPPPTGNYVLVWKVGAATALPGGQQLISDVTLVADAASKTFSSIPQTFTSLKLVMSLRCTSTVPQWVIAAINADATAARYIQQSLLIFGATTPQEQVYTPAGAIVGVSNLDTATAGDFATSEADFYYYRDTTRQKRIWAEAQETTASGVQLSAQLATRFTQTPAITSLVLTLEDGTNFRTGSRFTLYGIL